MAAVSNMAASAVFMLAALRLAADAHIVRDEAWPINPELGVSGESSVAALAALAALLLCVSLSVLASSTTWDRDPGHLAAVRRSRKRDTLSPPCQ